MRPILITLVLVLLTNLTLGQNLSAEKRDDCNIGSFCIDCGEIKGGYKGDLTAYFSKAISPEKIQRLKAVILVHVLIDTTGKQCVKNIQNDVPVLALKDIINSMTGWQPAIDKGRPKNVSVTLRFEIKDSDVSVTYQRFDLSNATNMQSVGTVKITNQQATLKNTTALDFEVFTTKNSIIPWDMTRAVSIDHENNVWLGTDNGIVKIQKEKMTLINSSNSSLKQRRNRITIMYSEVDSRNNKWFTDGPNLYKFDGNNWLVYDSSNTPLKWSTGIYADKIGNVWISSSKGLAKFDGSYWSMMDTSNSVIPNNNISGVYVDSQNRLWVGTYEGNIMIDSGKITNYDNMETPLRNASISIVKEDNRGNLWFSLYESKREYSGLAKLTKNGEWSMYNTSNSGIPSNDILDIEMDKKANVLWLSVNQVRIVRFDGEKWEIFSPENSQVPSTYIQDISLDHQGNLWCATFAGLLKITTK